MPNFTEFETTTLSLQSDKSLQKIEISIKYIEDIAYCLDRALGLGYCPLIVVMLIKNIMFQEYHLYYYSQVIFSFYSQLNKLI